MDHERMFDLNDDLHALVHEQGITTDDNYELEVRAGAYEESIPTGVWLLEQAGISVPERFIAARDEIEQYFAERIAEKRALVKELFHTD